MKLRGPAEAFPAEREFEPAIREGSGSLWVENLWAIPMGCLEWDRRKRAAAGGGEGVGADDLLCPNQRL